MSPLSFRRRNAAAALLLVGALVSSEATAQQLRGVGAPFVTNAFYDPVRERVVALGRDAAHLEWNGAEWLRGPQPLPVAPREGYVEPSGRVVLIGSPTWGHAPRFDVRDGDTWSSFLTSTGPGWRERFAGAFDPVRGEYVLFGGSDWASALNETWVFDGTDWSQVTTGPTPPARADAAMAYDPVRQRMVLFGGTDFTAALDDTWEWDGSSWSLATPAVRPTARSLPRMAYDTSRQRMVMCGGVGANGALTTCWEYDGTNWSQAASLPPALASSYLTALVYDAARSESVLIGGSDPSGSGGQVFAFDGQTWSQRAGLGYWRFVIESAVAQNPFGPGILTYGGSSFGQPASNELWNFDGEQWVPFGSVGQPLLSSPVMWTMNGLVYLFGENAAGTANETWSWNGGSWTQLPGVQPSGAYRHGAVAVDTAAGVARLGFQWAFDGQTWQQYSTFVPPYGAVNSSLAYDPVRNVTVASGGEAWQGGQYPGPIVPLSPVEWTYEFDGLNWSATPNFNLGSAPIEGVGGMAFDAGLGAVVFYEGYGTAYRYDGTWSRLPSNFLLGGFNYGVFRPMAATRANGRALLLDEFGPLEIAATPASTSAYGTACGVAAPTCGTGSRADVGNLSFSVEVANVSASGMVALIAGDERAYVPLLGCTLWTTPSLAAWFATATPTGGSSFALPLPNVPALVGADVCFQAAELQTATPNGFELSRGLRVVLGS